MLRGTSILGNRLASLPVCCTGQSRFKNLAAYLSVALLSLSPYASSFLPPRLPKPAAHAAEPARLGDLLVTLFLACTSVKTCSPWKNLSSDGFFRQFGNSVSPLSLGRTSDLVEPSRCVRASPAWNLLPSPCSPSKQLLIHLRLPMKSAS